MLKYFLFSDLQKLDNAINTVSKEIINRFDFKGSHVLIELNKKEYKVKLKDADKDFVFNETEADLNKFDKIIDELEPGSLRLPVLIKKYIKQNARLVAFNVDPLFNNAIDGLIYLRISDIPESTMKPVIEEYQAELERKSNEKEE